MIDKVALRRLYRARRRAIDAATRERFDHVIRQHLASAGPVARAGTLAAYAAFDGEPDLAPMLADRANTGTTILLPVVDDPETGTMGFHPWQSGDRTGLNQWGIEEPESGNPWAPEHIDVILIPLVAWDANGGRLGMGAGFYDRALAACRDATRPLRVGIGYACQQTEWLPHQEWDVPLHAVVTETGWFTCTP